MYDKKIVPCVKVIGGKAAEGPVYCRGRDAEDPVECAAAYARAGADEVLFLDAAAAGAGLAEVVRRAAAKLRIPIAAGFAGSSEELRELRGAGAYRVLLGSAAVREPGLIREAASIFGRGGVTVEICARRNGAGYWEVCADSGARMDAYGWAVAAERQGAGELLLVSLERGGQVKTFDADLARLIAASAGVPIASACEADESSALYGPLSEGTAASIVSPTLFRRSETSILALKRFMSAAKRQADDAPELLCEGA